MKRLICILLVAVLLCACGGAQNADKPAGSEQKREYGEDFAQRVVDAWKTAGYLDAMAPYSDMDLLDYYGIDLALCRCGAGYADAAGYTTEAVVVVADGAAADEIETLLSDHVTAMKEVFRSYDPEAYQIVENAVMLREDSLIVMIISPDAQAMLETLRGVTP